MNITIIGAGIVGLHIANLLNEKGHQVFILEKEAYLAEHTSGRNSGVIHAGIFYTPGSFKESVCIEGNKLTYEWAKKLNVAHMPCGKWVIPDLGQEDDFEAFFDKVSKLPIPKPQIFNESQIQEKEPLLRKTRGIFIPSTGIIDAAEYVKNFATYLESKGVMILTHCEVKDVKENTLETNRGPIEFDLAINSAGLFADEIADMTGLAGYEIKPCRGDYYLYSKSILSKPVYHLPYKDAHGLGLHLTPTIDGQTLIGPNAFFIDEKKDYKHQSEIKAYLDSILFYIPSLKNIYLSLAYSGNRPKLYYKGESLKEFTIVKNKNWIHLLGIESPGLTAAPALARHVLQQI